MAAPHVVFEAPEDANTSVDLSSLLHHALVAPSDTALWVGDYGVAQQAGPEDMVCVSAPLGDVMTGELDGAHEALGLDTDALLLAALGRAIARTFGEGVVVVDAANRPATTLLSCTTAPPAETSAMADASPADGVADIAFRYGSADPAPGGGHALELRGYRSAGQVYLDWWYDARRFEEYTVQELAEQYPLALIELTSEDCLAI
jgi:hypothetical protein